MGWRPGGIGYMMIEEKLRILRTSMGCTTLTAIDESIRSR